MGGGIVKYFYRMGPRIGIKVQKRSKIRSEEKRTGCAPQIHPRSITGSIPSGRYPADLSGHPEVYVIILREASKEKKDYGEA